VKEEHGKQQLAQQQLRDNSCIEKQPKTGPVDHFFCSPTTLARSVRMG
jgi:hypothetical protein